MENIKNLFNRFLELEAACDVADSAWEQDPESVELEEAFDRAYEAEDEALQALVNEIVSFTNSRIDARTARVMVMSKRTELQALISLI